MENEFFKYMREANERAANRGGSPALSGYGNRMESAAKDNDVKSFVNAFRGFSDTIDRYAKEDRNKDRQWEETKNKDIELNKELDEYSRRIKDEEENLMYKQNEYDKMAKKFEGKSQDFINNYRNMVMNSSAMRYGSDKDRESMNNFFDAVSKGERFRADETALNEAKQAYQDKYDYYQGWMKGNLPQPNKYIWDGNESNAEGQNQPGAQNSSTGNAANEATNALANAAPEDVVTYTYKPGDTFGQVLRNLGLESSKGLWGNDGDVAYYTKQLLDQGLWANNGNRPGNIPVGTTIKLVRRK